MANRAVKLGIIQWGRKVGERSGEISSRRSCLPTNTSLRGSQDPGMAVD